MTKTLSQIISDGTLVDNSVYQAETGVFRAGSFGPSVEIRQGGRGPNNPLTGWSLIHKAATLNTENSKLVFRVPDADYEHNTDIHDLVGGRRVTRNEFERNCMRAGCENRSNSATGIIATTIHLPLRASGNCAGR